MEGQERKENVVALQRAEVRWGRWMCDIKLKDRFPSKELRETRYGCHSIGITAEQNVVCMSISWSQLSSRNRAHGVDLTVNCCAGASKKRALICLVNETTRNGKFL